MGLEAGVPFGVVASLSVIDTCFESEGTLDKVHDLDETPLDRSHDLFVDKESPNLSFDDSVLPNPPIHSHAFPPLFITIFFPQVVH